jgi:hypothetical protein
MDVRCIWHGAGTRGRTRMATTQGKRQFEPTLARSILTSRRRPRSPSSASRNGGGRYRDRISDLFGMKFESPPADDRVVVAHEGATMRRWPPALLSNLWSIRRAPSCPVGRDRPGGSSPDVSVPVGGPGLVHLGHHAWTVTTAPDTRRSPGRGGAVSSL